MNLRTVFYSSLLWGGMVSNAFALDIFIPSSEQEHYKNVYTEIARVISYRNVTVTKESDCSPLCFRANYDARFEYTMRQEGQLLLAELQLIVKNEEVERLVFYGQTQEQLVFKAANHSVQLLKKISAKRTETEDSSKSIPLLSFLPNDTKKDSKKEDSIPVFTSKSNLPESKDKDVSKKTKKIRVGARYNLTNPIQGFVLHQGIFASKIPTEAELEQEDFSTDELRQASFRYQSYISSGDMQSAELSFGYWFHPNLLIDISGGIFWGDAGLKITRDIYSDFGESRERATAKSGDNSYTASVGIHYVRPIWGRLSVGAGVLYNMYMFPDSANKNILGFQFSSVQTDNISNIGIQLSPEVRLWKDLSVQFRYEYNYMLNNGYVYAFESAEDYASYKDNLSFSNKNTTTNSQMSLSLQYDF